MLEPLLKYEIIQQKNWSDDWSYAKLKKMKTKRKELNASEFKARCLKILDQLEPSGITILKRGKAVARVIPLPDRTPKQLIGSMKGKIRIKGDILKTGVKWDAQS